MNWKQHSLIKKSIISRFDRETKVRMNQLGWYGRNLFIFLTMVFLCVPFHDHTIVLVFNQVISITESKKTTQTS